MLRRAGVIGAIVLLLGLVQYQGRVIHLQQISNRILFEKAGLIDPAATHEILLTGAEGEVRCSATAVGAHTLLTAAHCLVGDDRIQVDDEPTLIRATVYDHLDHALLVLDRSFDDVLFLDVRDPRPDERVRIWGNPGGRRRVYREGVFLAKQSEGWFVFAATAPPWLLFSLSVFKGDSGAALITDEGKILSVVSQGNESSQCRALSLAFTSAQLRQIQ